MKKTFTVEEIRKLINEIQLRTNFTFQKIAFEIGVSVAMISKWKNGNLPISEKNFLRLEALSRGVLHPVTSNRANPPPSDNDDLQKRVLMLEERVLYLEKQIRNSFNTARQANLDHRARSAVDHAKLR